MNVHRWWITRGSITSRAQVRKLIETAEKNTGFARVRACSMLSLLFSRSSLTDPRLRVQADIIPIANFTDVDAHSLGVAKKAHLLRLLIRSIEYAQEERSRNRRRQQGRPPLAASAVPNPTSRGMPPAPSDAPSSTTGVTQAASLNQVSHHAL